MRKFKKYLMINILCLSALLSVGCRDKGKVKDTFAEPIYEVVGDEEIDKAALEYKSTDKGDASN